MRVRYQIIVEADADGMMGPLKVQEIIRNAVEGYISGLRKAGSTIEVGKIRIAAVYPLAPPEQKSVVERVPGSDQSRQVEEIRDQRIT